MNKIISTIAGIFSIITISTSSVAFAGEITTTGEGSTIESALHNAMREAIEQEIGILIGAKTFIQNRQLIYDEVLLKSKGFVAGYKIISQNQQAGIFKIKAKVNVRSEELETSLMNALEKKSIVEANLNDPRITVIAVDKIGTNYPDVENEIISSFQNHGFSRIVSQSDDADYVITINFNTAKKGSIYTANLAVKMINKNNEIIYADNFDGRSRMFTNNSEASALKSAAARAANAISNAAFNRAASLEQHITISVTHITLEKLGGLDNIKARIQAITGVSNVFIRSLSGGTAEIDVNYDGTASELAVQLKRSKIKIIELDSQYIKI